ncbi:MAG: hypothetical protein B6230_05285 [Desulfobacteraceae bacterium 4572_89]|nr:MAG: hypothetical protein B6230_05285 [Desulfobacteraceae bacterium 4572_89]
MVSLMFMASFAAAQEEFSFNLEEFEKKNLEWGGYAEIKLEHNKVNQSSAFALLDSHGDPRSSLDRFTSTLQLDGNYNKGLFSLNWVTQAYGRQDQEQWEDEASIFEAYASIKPTPMASIDLGKKVFKWGKGYAWNPVGFIDRPKNPNSPEESLEGYIGAGLDLIKSFSGPLQTMALTTVLLPVHDNINEDFGKKDNINLAAKLYLLYRDVDIDFLLYTGNSRTTRYGFDFSTNLATNFEIHGELAHIPEQSQKILDADGSVGIRKIADTSYLLGLRYLTENDVTTIIEYYHNDDGYTEEEQGRFFDLVDGANDLFMETGDDSLYSRAASISDRAYGRSQSGRNYLYVKVTRKEPFDLLYFTPGFTAIINLDDESFSLSPEAVYTGFTNWELRLRFSLIVGSSFTDYGEKQNENKLELRVRYFF